MTIITITWNNEKGEAEIEAQDWKDLHRAVRRDMSSALTALDFARDAAGIATQLYASLLRELFHTNDPKKLIGPKVVKLRRKK